MNRAKKFLLVVSSLMMLVWLGGIPEAHAQLREGDRMPSMNLVKTDGSVIEPADLRGKVVLTVFWATWCPVCMNELPAFQRLYDQRRDAGFDVLALSVDAEIADVKEYLQRSRLTFPVVMRTPALKEAWGAVQGTPLVFLADRRGVLRARYLGSPDRAELTARIDALLAEPVPARR